MSVQYLSQEKYNELEAELKNLEDEKIPTIAKRIDEARQQGDLSENAEYHDAREQMAWAQSRMKEVKAILQQAEIVQGGSKDGVIGLGSMITVKVNGKEREYTIVGAQEADPLSGKISNESPLGSAFMGKKKGDKVDVEVPAGIQEYTVLLVE